MLIRFVVSNYMSFKDETEFNLLPGKSYKSHSNHIKTLASGVKVTKASAIYGANGSGKSNLIQAMSFLRNFVLDALDEDQPIIPISKRFRLENSYKEKSSTFRIEFAINKNHFDYGIEIKKGVILDEWLYSIKKIEPHSDDLIFRRSESDCEFGGMFSQEDISFAKSFVKKILKDNESFLSKVSKVFENEELTSSALEWFKKFTIIDPYGELLSIPIISSEEDVRAFTSKMLKESKTGIESIHIKEVPFDVFFSYEDQELKQEVEESLLEIKEKANQEKEKAVQVGRIFIKDGKICYATLSDDQPVILIPKSAHLNNHEFELSEESDGTNRLIELAPHIHKLINNNAVVVIDEIERSMHPILAKQILNLFLQTSKTESQMIFSTHECNLLDQKILRQDEIWFVEKRKGGESSFYPLSDFSERNDKDIKKGYLQGRYGAIPFMSNLSSLNWETE